MKIFLASLLLTGTLAVAGTTATAQNSPTVRAILPEQARYEYCELMHTGFVNRGKPEKEKTDDIYVDFGYGYEKLGGSEQVKREAGKMEVFATPMSAVNYMGSLGWEIVQILENPISFHADNDPMRYVRRYVMRRAIMTKTVAAPR